MKEWLGRLVCDYYRIAKLLLSIDFFILMDPKISERTTSIKIGAKESKDYKTGMAPFSLLPST